MFLFTGASIDTILREHEDSIKERSGGGGGGSVLSCGGLHVHCNKQPQYTNTDRLDFTINQVVENTLGNKLIWVFRVVRVVCYIYQGA